jgi:hypothetical protein
MADTAPRTASSVTYPVFGHALFGQLSEISTPPTFFFHTLHTTSPNTNQTIQSTIQTMEKILNKSENIRKAAEIYKNNPEFSLQNAAKFYSCVLQSIINYLNNKYRSISVKEMVT